MAGIETKIKAVQGFIKILSWQKIAQVVVFLFVILLAWGIYENREIIYSFAGQPKLPLDTSVTKLSKASTDMVHSAVYRSDIIVGIQIAIVDFPRNTQLILHTDIDNLTFKETYDKYVAGAIAEIPLFNDDIVNNRRLIELINGEFVCSPFTTTITGKLFPGANSAVHSVCSNAIPPRYGKFTGTVNIYLARQPTSEEADQIRTLSRYIGTQIYDVDLKNGSYDNHQR